MTLKRKQKGAYRLPCGCQYTDTIWVLPMCDLHKDEHAEIKKRWQLDYEEFKKTRYP